MNGTHSDSVLSLTAGDVMSRSVKTVPDNMPLREAAEQLKSFAVRGAPVVDKSGRCVGVLSVSDVARWAARSGHNHQPRPLTCAFLKKERLVGGEEMMLCQLAEGECPIQQPLEMSNGERVIRCSEPHCVPTDWQIVELETVAETVRDVMTTEIVCVARDTPISDVARTMLNRGVHRVFVHDQESHPLGIVSVDDLIQVLAHPELSMSQVGF